MSRTINEISKDIRLAGVQLPGRKDEAIWNKAKEAVDKEKKYEKGSDTYWKVVQTVYEDMGGT